MFESNVEFESIKLFMIILRYSAKCSLKDKIYLIESYLIICTTITNQLQLALLLYL